MNIFKRAGFSLLVITALFSLGVSFLRPTAASAQDASVSAADNLPSVYAKDLSVSGTTISPGASLQGSFTAFNAGSSPASNLYYKVSLISDASGDSQTLGIMSGQPFSLDGKQSEKISFVYSIPSVSGSLTLRASVFTESGIELGRTEKDITVSGTSKTVDVVSSSVVVDGQAFDLQNGPTITASTTSAYVSVDLKNNSGSDVELVPNVSIFKKSVGLGTPVSQYATSSVTLKNGEEKTLHINIALPATPEVYEGEINFNSNGALVPQILFRLIRGGEIATIQSVSLGAGAQNNTVPVIVSYTGSPMDITTGDTGNTFAGSISVDVSDGNGNQLGSVTEPVTIMDSGSETISVPTESYALAAGLAAHVRIVDSEGKTLSEGQYTLAQSTSSLAGSLQFLKNNLLLMLIGVLALIVIIGIFYAFKHRKNGTMVLLALLLSGSVIASAFGYQALAQTNGTYVKSLGCSYQQMVVNSSGSGKSIQYSIGYTTAYASPCDTSVTSICQYATQTNASAKPVIQNTNCDSQSTDSGSNTCTLVSLGGKSTTVNKCIASSDWADSLTFDTTTGCTINYTDSHNKSQTVSYSNCSIIDYSNNVCTYFYNKKVRTISNCQSISDVSTDYSIKTSCYVNYDDSKGAKKNTTYTSCKDPAYDSSSGTCTFNTVAKNGTVTPQSISNCNSISYHAGTLDVRFFSPAPDSSGKRVFAPGSTQNLSGNLYYLGCTNTPESGSITLTMIDSSGKVVAGYYFEQGFYTGTQSSGDHSMVLRKGQFDSTFVAPTTPGNYSLLYTIGDTYLNGKGKISRQGYFNFTVSGSDDQTCGNGADDYPTCTTCSADESLVNGVCTSDNADDQTPPQACDMDSDCSDGTTCQAGYCAEPANPDNPDNNPAPTVTDSGIPLGQVSIKDFYTEPSTINPAKSNLPGAGVCNFKWDFNTADNGSICTITDQSLKKVIGFTPASSTAPTSYSATSVNNELTYKLSCGEIDPDSGAIATTTSKYATCYINSNYQEVNK